MRLIFMIMLFSLVSKTLAEVSVSKLGENYYVMSLGQTTCTKLNEKLPQGDFNIVFKYWLQGYFTAVNVTGAPYGFQVDQSRFDSALEFISNVCSDEEYKDEWLANIANIFWRAQFKALIPSAKSEPKLRE